MIKQRNKKIMGWNEIPIGAFHIRKISPKRNVLNLKIGYNEIAHFTADGKFMGTLTFCDSELKEYECLEIVNVSFEGESENEFQA